MQHDCNTVLHVTAQVGGRMAPYSNTWAITISPLVFISSHVINGPVYVAGISENPSKRTT